MSDNILEVKDLQVTFSTESEVVKAVDQVSFTVKKGQTLGIVGESGSGKSVTSLSVMRLIQRNVGKIHQGEILFQSRQFGQVDLAKLSDKQMRHIRGKEIAMIFQEPMTSLNPVYTCGNQVMEAILLHEYQQNRDFRQKFLDTFFSQGIKPAARFINPIWYYLTRTVNKTLQKALQDAQRKTIELFKKVRLPDPEQKFHTYPHEISGGQKQRVMIAMALSCNPSLLIADEPTTALDVTVQKTILDLLDILREEQDTSIIFITHDLGVIGEIADRVMVMYKGKIMEEGDAVDIFNNPKHPYTKGLLACRPRLDIKMKTLPVIDDFMEMNEEGILVEKEQHKYSSVGEALLFNFLTEDEIQERNVELKKQTPILEIEDLKKHFPVRKGMLRKATKYVKAVDGVSFKVYPGETVGLVGESGCGKTTLGRTILRLIEPTGGNILFEGQKVNTYNRNKLRRLRRDMQIIFQDPYSALNPRITIGGAIMEPMRLHKVLQNNKQRKEKVVELLETVGLKAAHFNRYPHEFSGGQRQRIAIARTLSLNPKFIIADESVSALDVSVQAQVLNLLNELKEKFNLTYIFISHDLSVVKFMADRIIVMNGGKIEEINDAEAIYENQKTEYTKKLINAIPKGTSEEIAKRKMAKRKRQEEKQKKQIDNNLSLKDKKKL